MFCRYCGKEILDEAVLCPHCGVMVKKINLPAQNAAQSQPVAQPVQQTPSCAEKKDEIKKTRLARVFGVVSSVFSGLSLLFVLSGFATMLYYWMGSSYYYDDGSFGAAIFMGLIALGTGIASFILGLRQKNAGVRYISTVIFVASIFSVMLPMVCL